MEMMQLRNGTTAPEVIVKTVILSLEHLWTEKPLVAYDLAMLAKDPGYVPFGSAMQVLTDFGLIDNGTISPEVRNVVLSAFDGDGVNMRLVDPTAQ